tara:strand:+ start:181 stop:360 length:180 start_codon:yes stop_codon:yes gene_type:complete
MGWIYKYIDNGANGVDAAGAQVKFHYAVGYYIKDTFEVITYFELESEAIARVSKLNGGT